jgi:hypothetical protein
LLFSYFSGGVPCFCLRLTQTTVVLSMASWVTGIIGLSHHSQLVG